MPVERLGVSGLQRRWLAICTGTQKPEAVMQTQQLARIASAALVSIVLGACATLTVGSYAERGATFTGVHSYAWGQPDALPTGDARLDNNPFFNDYVQGAIDKEFARRGVALSSPDTADLVVHYHINIAERLDVNRIDQNYGYCPSGNCEPRVDVVEAGTLVIDVHDAKTRNLVWRGWARDFVGAALFNQDVMEKQFTEQVRKMMAGFPMAVNR
jgi:hypothetical protein